MAKDNFNIIFFELDNDACPVQSFLDSLDDKMAAKMYGMMDILAEYGNELRMPYSEHLKSGQNSALISPVSCISFMWAKPS